MGCKIEYPQLKIKLVIRKMELAVEFFWNATERIQRVQTNILTFT